jgi:beta-lactamase regulating signal transducer with metallopeptidase domain
MGLIGDATSWIGERLITGSLQGAVVITLVWAACRWLPRVPASLQAWVWWLVALKLALTLVPLPALPLPLLPAADLGSTAEAAVVAPGSAGTSSGFAAAGLAETNRTLEAGSGTPTHWLAVVMMAWLVGVAAHGAMLLHAAAGLRRIVRRSSPLSNAEVAPVSALAVALGLKRVPRVRASGDVGVPQVVGWRRPVVLLPPDATSRFTSDEWRMALAHELMHVRRRDVLLGWVPALAERLYFFHPLVRIAAREYVTAREAACDAAVVQALDVPADDYGRLLVRIGVGRSTPVLVASSGASSASCLKRRLDMLQHIPSKTASRLLTGCVAAAAVMALAPVRLVAVPSQTLPALPALPALAPAPPALPAPPTPPAPPRQAAPAAPVAAPAAPLPPLPPLQPLQPPQSPQPAAPAPPQAPQAPQAQRAATAAAPAAAPPAQFRRSRAPLEEPGY